jgi:hypothetical protein
MHYTIRRFAITPLARFGCVLGTLVSVIPACLCSLPGLWLVSAIRHLLEGWRSVTLFDMLGQKVTVNFIDLLNLNDLLRALRFFDDRAWLTLVAAIFFFCLTGGLAFTAIAAILGLGYNQLGALSGGLVVELDERPKP